MVIVFIFTTIPMYLVIYIDMDPIIIEIIIFF